MFRKALESILRVSLRDSSCVCYQPALTLFIWYRTLLYSGFPLGFTLTQSHKPRWEAHGEIYCHTNKHIHNRDPEKVQWESRCQFSHVALMEGPEGKYQHEFFHPPRFRIFSQPLTRSPSPKWRWEHTNVTALTDSSQRKIPVGCGNYLSLFKLAHS